MTKLLLDEGANPKLTTQMNGQTISPLRFSAQMGRFEVASLLLKRGSDVNEAYQENRSPLHLVVSNKYLNDAASSQMAELLLKNGANPNQKMGEDEITPLHLAVNNDSLQKRRSLCQ